MKIKNETIEDIKYIAFGIILALLINRGLGLVLGTDLPVVAVVSDSMTHDETTQIVHYKYLSDNYGYSAEELEMWPLENGFNKGDVLVVKGVSADEVQVGDVLVYNRKPLGGGFASNTNLRVPIVHRVIDIDNGEFTTKGDHNPTADPWEIDNIRGKAIIRIPYLGWPKYVLNKMVGL
jgi:signal peptidase I